MKRACLLLLPALLLSVLFVTGCNDESNPKISRMRVSPACGVVPLEVEAYAVATGGNEGGDPLGGNNNLEIAWNFGDGGTGASTRAYHTFRTPGTYDVLVTATDPDGASARATFPVRVLPDSLMITAFTDDEDGVITTADTVRFRLTAVSCDVDYPAVRDDSVKVAVRWEMNDGSGAVFRGVSPRYSFAAAGDYEIDLTVTYPALAVTRRATVALTVNDVP